MLLTISMILIIIKQTGINKERDVDIHLGYTQYTPNMCRRCAEDAHNITSTAELKETNSTRET